jgi:hypothetical protein
MRKKEEGMKKIMVLMVGLLLIGVNVFADDVSINDNGNITTGTSSSGNLEVTGASAEKAVVGLASGTGGTGVHGENTTYGNVGSLGGFYSTYDIGVYGYSVSGFAGYFEGDARVTGNMTVDGVLTGYTETDPVYSAWDKSAGISITESQISDLIHFMTGDEADPTVVSSVKDGVDWSELSGVPAGFADGVDDTGSALAQRVVVAQSGGDYTSISAALAAISPSASSPYVIDVMPGTYTENITMKSYVHLRGAGRDVTTLTGSSSSPIISIDSLTNVAISGLTVSGGTGTEGIAVTGGATAYIFNNTIRDHGVNGIINDNSDVKILNNIIIGNGLDGGGSWPSGIYTYVSRSIITGNVIHSNSYGIVDLGISGGAGSTSVLRGNLIYANTVGAYILESDTYVVQNSFCDVWSCNTSNDVIVSNPSMTHAANVSYNVFEAGPVDGFGNILRNGSLAYLIRGSDIYNGAIDTAKIKDGGIYAADLRNGSVQTAKLADASVSSVKLQDSSVTEAKLGSGSVTNGKLNLSVSEYGPITAQTSTPETETTAVHSFCALTEVTMQAAPSGTNKWCKLIKNGDNTWTLSARGDGVNAWVTCAAKCF